jgi:hypothetical protein
MNQPARIPALDLTRHHFMRPSGDLVLFGTWIYNPDQQDYEPCLVVVPRYRRQGFKPCCIALSSAWKYNPEHNGAAYLARMSKEFLYMLGMEDCMSNAMKVAELVNSHLGDLIRMPNNPMSSIITADATFSFDDGTRRTVEVVDYKPLAQA